jgi:hypothetical protein
MKPGNDLGRAGLLSQWKFLPSLSRGSIFGKLHQCQAEASLSMRSAVPG